MVFQDSQKHECMLLSKELFQIREKKRKNGVYVTITHERWMDCAASAYRNWLVDYDKDGVVSRVSIDVRLYQTGLGCQF